MSPEGLEIQHQHRPSAGNHSPAKCQVLNAKYCYRFAVPRANFFTLLFLDPRAYSRGFNGFSALRFLRAVRFSFLRSSLLKAAVFAMSAMGFLLTNFLPFLRDSAFFVRLTQR
jgi:hypothetical protein